MAQRDPDRHCTSLMDLPNELLHHIADSLYDSNEVYRKEAILRSFIQTNRRTYTILRDAFFQLCINQHVLGGEYLLGCAVEMDNVEVARSLIRLGVDVNKYHQYSSATGLRHSLPLIRAVYHGSIRMVDLLINAGADVWKEGWKKDYRRYERPGIALSIAIEAGHAAIANRLAEYLSTAVLDADHYRLREYSNGMLLAATRNRFVETVWRLLRGDIRIDTGSARFGWVKMFGSWNFDSWEPVETVHYDDLQIAGLIFCYTCGAQYRDFIPQHLMPDSALCLHPLTDFVKSMLAHHPDQRVPYMYERWKEMFSEGVHIQAESVAATFAAAFPLVADGSLQSFGFVLKEPEAIDVSNTLLDSSSGYSEDTQ